MCLHLASLIDSLTIITRCWWNAGYDTAFDDEDGHLVPSCLRAVMSCLRDPRRTPAHRLNSPEVEDDEQRQYFGAAFVIALHCPNC